MSNNEKDYIVEFDDQGAFCKRPDGSQERVNWGELIKVTIEATAGEAKDAPAHVWILWGRDNKSGCVYPGGATGAELMLVEMQRRLKNFDVGAVAKALKSEENQTWMLWQAPGVNSPEGEAPRTVN
jgi:hypothetical protein